MHDAPPSEASSGLDARFSATRLGQRIAALVDTMLNGVDLTLTDTAPEQICRLPAKDYRATEFDMSQPRVEALLNAATGATAAFLDGLEARGQLPTHERRPLIT